MFFLPMPNDLPLPLAFFVVAVVSFLLGAAVMGILDDLYGPGTWVRPRQPDGSRIPVSAPLWRRLWEAAEYRLACLALGVSREERRGELRADTLVFLATTMADTPPAPTPTERAAAPPPAAPPADAVRPRPHRASGAEPALEGG